MPVKKQQLEPDMKHRLVQNWERIMSRLYIVSSLYLTYMPVQFTSVQFSCSVMSNSPTPWTAVHQASLSITNSQRLLKIMSIESVMPSNHLILCLFSFCLQPFPASQSFPMNQLFASGDQSIGASASASVLPMNIQD